MYFSKGKEQKIRLTKYQIMIIVIFLIALYFHLTGK
jgi:hypothetical protein